MASYTNTHYERGTLLTFGGKDVMLLPPNGSPAISDSTTIVATSSATFISLAYKYYGNSTNDPRPYWALIAEANPHVLDPFNIPPGETLIIPAFRQWPILRR